MTEIFSFLGDTLINALGWTFVHSLWQGSLIALVMTAILSRVPEREAHKRYTITAISLLAVLLCAMATFCMMYPFAASTAGSVSPDIIEPVVAISGDSLPDGIYTWITDLNPLFVSVWVMGVVFFTVRFGLGLVYLRHLRHHAVTLPAQWQEMLNQTARRIGYQKHVRLAQSALLRIPVVIGTVKPIILFPIGMINQLHPEEIEAILAHEVAHLMRHDFVHNLIQSLIEVIFYYHPAVWWISAMVRSERENCCDDLGVKVCGNSLTYAKALVKLQDISYSSPALALPFSGSKGHLLNRIKRVLNQPQNKSNVMEKVIATVILIGCVTLLSFTYQNDPVQLPQDETYDVALENHYAITDTVPKQQEVIVWENADGRTIELRKENGEVAFLSINGEEIDPAEYDHYQEELEQLNQLYVAPPAPPMPPMAPEPGMAPIPPVPPVPGDLHFAPQPTVPGRSHFQKERSTTTTIIREKNGDGYIYRVESDGDGAEVIVQQGKGIAIVNGQEVILDADSVFIIEKEEVNRFGSPNRVHFKGISPDVDFNFEFPDVELSKEQLAQMEDQLREYKFLLKDDKGNVHRFSNEWYGELKEESAKEIEQHARELEKQLQEHPAFWNEMDEHRLRSEQRVIAEDADARTRTRLGGQMHTGDAPALLFNSGENEAFQYVPLRTIDSDAALFFAREREPFGQITSAMDRDGMIDKDGDYTIVLEEGKLKVNGKRMPDEVHQKYLEIFERSQGYSVSGKTKIEISSKN